MAKVSKKAVIDAIKDSDAVISTIADRLGVAWNTARKYIHEWEETRQAFADEEEKVLDLADTALYDAIRTQEPWAVKYILSTKGKKRGYVERTEHTGADGAPLEPIRVVIE